MKIGITGQEGFIGLHLYNTLCLFPDIFDIIPFKKEFFNDSQELNNFVSSCDVIVHLAALNRHSDPEVIFETNIGLVEKLIRSLEATNSCAHVFFSSSSQEDNDNLYGKSKKIGRELFIDWAKRSEGTFTGLVIPNVFGPFGNPFYNSFIATFSHQLLNNQTPIVNKNSLIKLIYVGDLVKKIIEEIESGVGKDTLVVSHTDEKGVSEILSLLVRYKNEYFGLGIIPVLNDRFEVNIFNTFRSFIDIEEEFPKALMKHTDPRGSFVEILRLNIGGQVSFSTTLAGVTRGNHFHTRKIERFAVIKGKALIQLRRIGSDKIYDFYLDGEEPSYVDMPIWYTHNIKNIGDDELYTNFWINEFYDAADSDTFMEEV